jgi:hypothetical protein
MDVFMVSESSAISISVSSDVVSRHFATSRRWFMAAATAMVMGSAASPADAQPPLAPGVVVQTEYDCPDVEQCIAIMRTVQSVNLSGNLMEKIISFGDAATHALIEVLTHDPDQRMRSFAGSVLNDTPGIDRKYLPILIEQDKAGDSYYSGQRRVGWLLAAIGKMRDDPVAIGYLFDVAEAVPAASHSADNGIRRSSPQIWQTEARKRLEAFRPDQSVEYLDFLYSLSPDDLRRGADGGWREQALVRIATDPAMSPETHRRAEVLLGDFRNPIALAAILREARPEFEKIEPRRGQALFTLARHDRGESRVDGRDGEWAGTIAKLGAFGGAAHEAGPMLLPFLARPDLPTARTKAALALGQIGYREAIPTLMTALHDRNDWLLAYNAAESLGRLKAVEASADLRELARHHWSEAVRRNASRALNFLAGGAFEIPDSPGSGRGINDHDDTEASREGDAPLHGEARFRGDDSTDDAECLWDASGDITLSQAPIGRIRFPPMGAAGIEAGTVTLADIPASLSRDRRSRSSARVSLVEPLSEGVLVGTDAGEFSGSLVHLMPDGTEAMVVPDNVRMAFRQGGRLYVLTGLSHLGYSYGELWEVDEHAMPARAVRRIRLLVEADEVMATARGEVALKTGGEVFLLRRDGTLESGSEEATCSGPGRRR